MVLSETVTLVVSVRCCLFSAVLGLRWVDKHTKVYDQGSYKLLGILKVV